MPVHLRLLDTDGSVDGAALGKAAAWDSSTQVDLRDLGPALRLWSRRKTVNAARGRIAAAPDPRPSITFMGSGDFHHLAALLAERIAEPFTLLHFDNHPDWVRLAPRWHCGSWVNRVLALPNVRRVVTAGVCSDDLVNPARKGGNLAALDAGRLALLPWQHEPSRVRRRVHDGPGHSWQDGFIHWRNLAEMPQGEAVAMVLDAIPTDAVWITIDKDVLPEHEALTNWDQGDMPLAALVATLYAVGQRKRVLGADVCGEYSPPHHANWFKRIEARMDQPTRNAGDQRRIDANTQTDCTLARALFAACARSAAAPAPHAPAAANAA
ncbi:MAG: arginase [Rhodanobacteraceae bacterium]|nr:MAG: arginase [Rhodanobacteraceae bacterium]